MSLRNFLSNVWDLLCHIWDGVEQFVKNNVHAAVIVTKNIKDFTENPVGEFLIAVIDDRIPIDLREKIREILPKVLLSLELVDSCKGYEGDELYRCIAERMQLLTEDARDAKLHSLAALIAKELSDGELTISDGFALVEWYYRNKVKK